MVQQDLKIWIILIHITDARRCGYIIPERAELAGRSRRAQKKNAHSAACAVAKPAKAARNERRLAF